MRIALRIFLILALAFVVAEPAWAAKKKPKMKEAPKRNVGEKPDISRIEPMGIQRGIETKIKLIGTNLVGLTDVKFSNTNLTAEISDAPEKVTEAWITVKASKTLKRSAYELSVVNAKGESAKVKLYVDDVPQAQETEAPARVNVVSLPVSFWGALNPMGDTDEVEFRAAAGQDLVFDLGTRSIGSKADALMSLLDEKGNLLASNSGFDSGDPFLAYTIPQSGRYRVRITDATAAGSREHFYRLTMGELPAVVGIFPLSVRTNAQAEIELIGYNLRGKNKVKIKPMKTGDLDVALDTEKFRARRGFKVLVTDTPEVIEAEPNDMPAQANWLPVPGSACGRINAPGKDGMDSDLFRFDAKAGEVVMIETMAARRTSPVDTRIEVLWPDGKAVERLQLQAVRNSAINFKDIDSVTVDLRVENWQEMELNQFMYLQGEVCKIFRMPEGPDSGFQFYRSAGRRKNYFDTSATAHALDEPCYIVEPHPVGEKLVPNGLPVFPLYYANDDDGERELGSDSRLQFTPPRDGSYLVRVTDNRGYSGERFVYRLTVRPAQPDFTVKMANTSPTVAPGVGQEFSLSADRIDGFDGDIKVEFFDIPKGFLVSTPIEIQAGHLEAKGVIYAATNATEAKAEDIDKIKVTATAMIEGKPVTKTVNAFTALKVGEKPKLLVSLEPYVEIETNFLHRTITDKPLEITIAPGETIPAWLKIERQGHGELATFTAGNFPHGVIIDNIGLNGVLIPKEDNRREIFIRAAKWVPETDRLIFVKAAQAGDPTCLPVLLHVRRTVGDRLSVAK